MWQICLSLVQNFGIKFVIHENKILIVFIITKLYFNLILQDISVQRTYLLIFVFRISGCICMSENGHVVFRYCMSYAGLELY